MKVTIQSLHFDADRKLLNFINQKCGKLDQYYNHITDATVTLRLEKDHEHGNKVAEILLNVPGQQLVAKEQCKSFEEAIDVVTDQLRKQLVRFKERQRAM